LSFTTLAAPPVVTAASATQTTTTTAKLGGSVNAEASDTTVKFVYGTDPNLATGTTTTTTQHIGSGATPVSVTAPLTGLTPNTTYYFQLVAHNAAGTSSSSIISFATAAQAPDVTTTAATHVTAKAATLNGSVNALAADTTVTFVYSTNPNLSAGAGTTTTA